MEHTGSETRTVFGQSGSMDRDFAEVEEATLSDEELAGGFGDSYEDGDDSNPDAMISDAEALRRRESAWNSVMDECSRTSKDPLQMSAQELGKRGELLAARYLDQRGYEIVECNMRNYYGEADIVAREDNCVVLVEVKTRLALQGDDDVIPELAVNDQKQKRYRNIALRYLEEHPECTYIRFDVIAIKVEAEHHANLRHLVGAFVCDI